MSAVARRTLNILTNPFMKVGSAYNSVAVKHPFSTGVITTFLKTSAADLFAQKILEKREEVDWRRHALFCSFGLGYLGCFQYFLYNKVFVRICAPITAVVGHKGSAVVKTFLDQFIHHPIGYFPVFYLLKGVQEGRPLELTYIKYKQDLWENCKALWTIWVPAQLVNFAFVPGHLRIPFVALVSFLWTIIISCMRGATQLHDDDSPADEITEGNEPFPSTPHPLKSASPSRGVSSIKEVDVGLKSIAAEQ